MQSSNALLDRSIEFYNIVQSKSKVIPTADLAVFGIKDDGGNVNVYEGNMKDIGAQMKLPYGTSSNIGRLLRGLGCIVELRRGGLRPGLWLVLHPPTEKDYNAQRDQTYVTSKNIMPSKYDEIIQTQAKMQTRIDELSARVDYLENRLSEVLHGDNAR